MNFLTEAVRFKTEKCWILEKKKCTRVKILQ